MQTLSSSFDPKSGTVAVIGAGVAAVQAVRLLRSAGANVRWYASDVDVAEEVLLAFPPPGWLELSFADPLGGRLIDVAAVVSAAGKAIDEAVAAQARAADVPVHVVGRPDISTFQLTAPVTASPARRAAWITGPIGGCWKAAQSQARRAAVADEAAREAAL